MTNQLSLDFGASPPASVLAAVPPPDFGGACVLVQELARLAANQSKGRRRAVFVARSRSEGKALLRQVVLRGQSWAGLEVTTVQLLALQVAMPRLLREGVAVADAFDHQALIERSIDDAISGGAGQPMRFARFVNKVGFREAVRQSVVDLREGGVRVDDLTPAVIDDREKLALIAEVLGHYEAHLRKDKLVDSAWLLESALDELATPGEARDEPAAVYLSPGLSDRGLSGRFVRTLEQRGAVLLKTDAVEGLPPPSHLLWDVKPPTALGSWLHAGGRRAAAAVQPRLDETSSISGTPTPGTAPAASVVPVASGAPVAGGGLECIDLFAAASVYDELRGVLRRALDRGARWDQIEITTPDTNTYGSALHALAEPLGIKVNFAVGLPVERTRPGRVASAYFRWIENGFQEPVLRALVEAGDVKAPKPYGRIRGPQLARELRRLRIGWGESRYVTAVERALADLPELRKGRYDDDERFERRKKRTEEDLQALRALLKPVLAATPSPTDGPVSPARVAAGAMRLLDHVAPGTPTDEKAHEELVGKLRRVEATQKRPTDFTSACNIVKGFLQRVRVPTPQEEGTAPWGAAPGYLHLSNFEHGGATGRPFTFVVGLDSARFPGGDLEDPLLLDKERVRLGRGVLPLAADRAAEARFLFAGLLARLRGEVSFSYCRWDPAEARALNPAPEMLQAYRLREGNDSLTFDDLERALGLAESRLPRSRVHSDVDASDVWLRSLSSDADGGRLRDGVAAVSRAYPGLARGIEVDRALKRDEPSVHAGILGGSSGGSEAGDPSYLDPFAKCYSASTLEDLGACPRRYLLRHVVRARPPDDPEFDPERWLDGRQRGRLLHDVYQKTLLEARADGLAPKDDAFLALALRLVNEEGRHASRDYPSPSVAVREWEMDALRDDVRSFVEMMRADPPNWLEVEWRFGFDNEQVRLDTPAGAVRVMGAVDRVDDRPGGGLRVVDYKTGGTFGFRGKAGTYDGGRRLQHVLYCHAASQLLGQPAEVDERPAETDGRPANTDERAARMEYHFPTRRGENVVKSYAWNDVRRGVELVAMLLNGVSRGSFPATEEVKKDCGFCDYKAVCDVRLNRWGPVSSRYADWTKRNLEDMDELAILQGVRNWEREGGGFGG